MFSQRLQRLQDALSAASLEAVALIAGPNLFYLTGLSFHLSERPSRGAVVFGRRNLLKVRGGRIPLHRRPLHSQLLAVAVGIQPNEEYFLGRVGQVLCLRSCGVGIGPCGQELDPLLLHGETVRV